MSDLSPLEGMPLTNLVCRSTHVSDLSPLDGLQEPDLPDMSTTPKSLPPLSPPCKKPCPTARSNGTIRARQLPSSAYLDPAFQQWVKATQALPAEKQIEAVSKKLMELNPGFDGKVTDHDGKGPPKIENGVVTELGLFTDNVTDISPVRAFTGLKFLSCAGTTRGRGKLFDLSPLNGMPLIWLNCNST